MKKMDVILSLVWLLSGCVGINAASENLSGNKESLISAHMDEKSSESSKKSTKKQHVVEEKKAKVKKSDAKESKVSSKSLSGLQLPKSEAELNALIATGKPLLLDVYIPGCPACNVAAPRVKKLAESNADIIVAKINASKFNFVRKKYKLSGFPTFLYFKGGQNIGRVVGSSGTGASHLKKYLGV